MVKFKCNHTGNVYTFENEKDIEDLREHTEYTEIIEEVEQEETPKATRKKKDK